MVRLKDNPNKDWGTIPLTEISVAKEDRVIIIQHPSGLDKQIAMSHNFVTYSDDSNPGSSGSPVFNETWEVVALHNTGGWLREPGQKDALFRNGGIAINRVIMGIKDLLVG